MKITPDQGKLRYSGRIDFSDPKAPLMVFPCSFVTFRFTGDILRVTVENRNAYWKNYIGYMLDGQQHTVALEMSGRQRTAFRSATGEQPPHRGLWRQRFRRRGQRGGRLRGKRRSGAQRRVFE